MQCWHYASIAIQIAIRDVPEKVRDQLAARAALQGKLRRMVCRLGGHLRLIEIGCALRAGIPHSYLSALAGFVRATMSAWLATVASAIPSATAPTPRKMSGLRSTCKVKPCSQRCIE